jgi:hypothetical protein
MFGEDGLAEVLDIIDSERLAIGIERDEMLEGRVEQHLEWEKRMSMVVGRESTARVGMRGLTLYTL